MRLLAHFHGIGNVGIADRILFKAGTLTSAEATEMHRHCEIGYRIAQSTPDLVAISDWVLKHYEWWNGRGYPLGLKGDRSLVKADILVFRSLNVDFVVTAPRHPVGGETAMGTGFQMHSGGKGANQAVAAARVGGRVAMAGRVGGDTFGEACVFASAVAALSVEKPGAQTSMPTRADVDEFLRARSQ